MQNRVSSALASLPQAVQAQGVTVQKKSTAILQIVTLTSPDGRYDSLYLATTPPSTCRTSCAPAGRRQRQRVRRRPVFDADLARPRTSCRRAALTPQDVIQALQQQNQQVTAGQLGTPPTPDSAGLPVHAQRRWPARRRRASSTTSIVKTGSAGEITRLRDIGRVELGAQTYSQVFTLDGQPAAGIGIFQSPGANALDVAGEVAAPRWQGSGDELSAGLAYSIPFDTTVFVSASIDEVYKTLFEAAILVLIVILLFLQDWRAMLVPATTVPVTIIGAFAAMAALGFTVNLSTLFAIVLAIGIVVDDAIVVVEGAAHNIEQGMCGHDAAIRAMDELFGPIIGITLVLMSVFLPAAFLPGLTGRMYAQFALVIAATALLSAINAATLKPTQCALWLRPPGAAGAAQHRSSRLQRRLRPVRARLCAADRRAWSRARAHVRDRADRHRRCRLRPHSDCRPASCRSRTRAICWPTCNCRTALRSSAPQASR